LESRSRELCVDAADAVHIGDPCIRLSIYVETYAIVL